MFRKLLAVTALVAIVFITLAAPATAVADDSFTSTNYAFTDANWHYFVAYVPGAEEGYVECIADGGTGYSEYIPVEPDTPAAYFANAVEDDNEIHAYMDEEYLYQNIDLDRPTTLTGKHITGMVCTVGLIYNYPGPTDLYYFRVTFTYANN